MRSMLKVLVVFLSVIFISGCAAGGAKYSSESGATSDMTNVVIYRPYLFRSGGLYANVTIDGQQVGKLKNAGYLQFHVGRGTHTLKVGGQTKEISISSGEKKFFRFTYGWALFAAMDVVSDRLDAVDEQAALTEIKDTKLSD